MTRRQRIWLASILALASACLTIALLGGTGASAQTHVVVTTREVQPFTVLKSSDLTVIAADRATAKSLFPDAYAESTSLVGQVAVRHLRKNEVLRQDEPVVVPLSALSDAAADLPLSSLVPDGQRALTLPGLSVGAVPGDYIQLFTSQGGSVRPVLDRPVQVAAAKEGELVILLSEAEAMQVLSAQLAGGLEAVLAPPHLG